MALTDEIKARLDIVSYIGQSVALKKSGKHYKGLCPFHSEQTPSFMVNPDRQTWHCYGACGEGGDVIAFAMKKHGWSFGEAVAELARQAGIEVKPRSSSRQVARTREQLRGLLAVAAEAYHNSLERGSSAAGARAYLEQRGIRSETRAAWRLGYAPAGRDLLARHLRQAGFPDALLLLSGLCFRDERGAVVDFLRDRLVYPLCDERGHTAGFAARALREGQQPKYLNTAESPVFSKSKLLYGLDRAREAALFSGQIVLVEGYMDVLAAHQAGYTNVIASMGTALTAAQVELLHFVPTIYVALDGDSAGREATRRALEGLAAIRRDIRIVSLPAGKDPDEVIRAGGWQAVLDEAEAAGDYLLGLLTRGVDAHTPIAVREALAQELVPLLTRVESGLYRHHYLQKLALALAVPETLLAAYLPADQLLPAGPVLLPPTAAAARAPLQAQVVNALLADHFALSRLQRLFRSIQLADFCAADVPHYAPAFEVLQAALDQDDLDIEDYVQQHLAPHLLPEDTPEVDDNTLARLALRLRLERTVEDLEALLDAGDLDGAQGVLLEKARTQQQLQRLTQ